jgi:hypothetical protein
MKPPNTAKLLFGLTASVLMMIIFFVGHPITIIVTIWSIPIVLNWYVGEVRKYRAYREAGGR